MGRNRWTDRRTVEECPSICIRDFVRFNRLAYLGSIPATLTWEGVEVDRVRCTLAWHKGELVLHLSNDPSSSKVLGQEQLVSTSSTPCNFGGQRQWLICPGLFGNTCGRRCTALYISPNGGVFACRCCLDLTYRSSREHDKRLDRIMRNPELLSAALESPNLTQSLLGMRAHAKLIRRLLSKQRSGELQELWPATQLPAGRLLRRE
jgi:hypothetical protein